LSDQGQEIYPASDAVRRADWALKTDLDDEFFAELIVDFAELLNLDAWPTLDQYRQHFGQTRDRNSYPELVPQSRLGQRGKAKLNQQIRSGKITASSQRYEYLVAKKGVVPVKTNSWHDFFNVYTWWKYPQTKRALFDLAYVEVEAYEALHPREIFATRTSIHDRLTAFEEGAVVLLVDPENYVHACQCLQFPASRKDALVMDFVRDFAIYGHAIYEEVLFRKRGHLALAFVVPTRALQEDFDELISVQLNRDGALSGLGVGSIPIDVLSKRDLMKL
jgi:hypothetical protein